MKITSIDQLDSNTTGHLVVVKVEKMSDEYNDGESTVGDLMSDIIALLQDNSTKEIFLEKLSTYGYSPSELMEKYRFSVDSLLQYKVDDEFPRLTRRIIPYEEITNALYELSLPMIEKYREE